MLEGVRGREQETGPPLEIPASVGDEQLVANREADRGLVEVDIRINIVLSGGVAGIPFAVEQVGAGFEAEPEAGPSEFEIGTQFEVGLEAWEVEQGIAGIDVGVGGADLLSIT
ncbi:MAG: hypothetical protein BWZ02_02304 [Lentisphaerae bacterium ADurb.BinA184]|nr:MAG: hypothetical protein BWZ02_02304 [Lentisphaerae bacterium ADurb.BinA184]